MSESKGWKPWVMGIAGTLVSATLLTGASGVWSSAKDGVHAEHRLKTAEETTQAHGKRIEAIEAKRAADREALVRIETMLVDVVERLRRVETKLDAEDEQPKRGRVR